MPLGYTAFLIEPRGRCQLRDLLGFPIRRDVQTLAPAIEVGNENPLPMHLQRAHREVGRGAAGAPAVHHLLTKG